MDWDWFTTLLGGLSILSRLMIGQLLNGKKVKDGKLVQDVKNIDFEERDYSHNELISMLQSGG